MSSTPQRAAAARPQPAAKGRQGDTDPAPRQDLRVFDRYLTRLREQGAKGAAAVPPEQAFEPYLMSAIDAARKLSATLMRDMTAYPPANAMWERHQRERIEGLRQLVERCVASASRPSSRRRG